MARPSWKKLGLWSSPWAKTRSPTGSATAVPTAATRHKNWKEITVAEVSREDYFF